MRNRCVSLSSKTINSLTTNSTYSTRTNSPSCHRDRDSSDRKDGDRDSFDRKDGDNSNVDSNVNSNVGSNVDSCTDSNDHFNVHSNLHWSWNCSYIQNPGCGFCQVQKDKIHYFFFDSIISFRVQSV